MQAAATAGAEEEEEEDQHGNGLGEGRRGGRGCESALYEAICPAIYVIRVFGLAPYAYPKDNRPPRLRPSSLNCLFTVGWIGVYSYIVVTSLLRFQGLDRNKPVLGVTENGKLVLNYLVILVDLLLCLRWRGQFVQVWNAIQEFDARYVIESTGIVRRTRLWLWLCLLASLVAWTTINQLGMRAFEEPYLQNVSYMIVYVGSFIAVFKFCGLVLLLGQRFAYLNDLVADRLLAGLANDQAALLFIKKIESSYSQLLGTSEKLNDIYSWSLLLFLLNLCCHTVSNMYFFIIWTIVDPQYLSNPKVVFCEFSWLLIYLVQLLLLHVACHFASLEANRMALGLLDWRRHAYRQSKQSEFSSTLHLLNRKLNFTAAGCFSVNLPLLTSTVGYLSTYLIILLQIPDATGPSD